MWLIANIFIIVHMTTTANTKTPTYRRISKTLSPSAKNIERQRRRKAAVARQREKRQAARNRQQP